MDEILKALPVPTAMLAAAVIGLWKRLIDREKECATERQEAEEEYRKLAREYVELSTKHAIASAKLARLSDRSSDRPQT